ncbi:hypothetical protein LJ737_26740 [Hymenobacter sp. 15J16-1T3B]|uniref:hypothetical protein n=1 Tax=Hymenobacter sp. 15J16-1T3B TaxID=2886941 RepID=UPI001D10AB68|nr:hypothetical protein [Hymenobacter sp. 15J16-1T3B]MCC3160864.1 hypothetical protein [Hymenobacter sp. 15J16-1T3B]
MSHEFGYHAWHRTALTVLGFGGLLGLGLGTPAARAQTKPASPREALDAYHQNDPYEKLFLHLDRRLYVGGDLLWFKAYAVEGTRQRPLALSKVAYVEVLDARQKPVLQGKIGLQNATGHGSFQLPASLPTGTYTVRAYTSLMRNFGPDSYFHTPITVVNTFAAATRAAADTVRGYDVQFFPEGGTLVAGVKNRVAVKVTDKTGHGIAAEGVWLDKQGQVAARFSTLKYGMGRFDVQPTAAGGPYTAVTRLPDQQTLTRQAPAVQEQGFAMRVEGAGAEQLLVTVQTPGNTGEEVQLLGHARQRVFAAKSAAISGGRAQFVLERAQLPEGVLHLTVFNARQQPVAERLVFRRPAAQLAVRPVLDNSRYGSRDKVALTLTTADAAGRPAPANLSVAVYRLDDLPAPPAADIASSLWLTSELRGMVEDPGYYLAAPDGQADEATDNLMLTQGWRRFSWDKLLAGAGTPDRYLPELNGQFVEARVVHKTTGQPLVGVAAFASLPSTRVRLYNAISRADGRVRFELREVSGPQHLVLQADARQDSTARMQLISPFSTQYAARPAAAPLLLPEQYRAALTQRHVEVQSQAAYFSRKLRPFALPLADSASFYGKADESYNLDDYTRFGVMEEVMREYVPGVQVRLHKQEHSFLVSDRPNRRLFTENPLVLFDGVPMFNIDKVLKIDPLKVRRLEVMTNLYVHGPLTYSGLVSYTSYKGDLGGVAPGPGALVEEFEGLQWEREFYSPNYATPEQKGNRLLDLRNLLYWNPEVTTSSTGQKLEFFTADEPGQYQVVVQGLSGTGLAGSSTATFEVRPQGLAQGK